MEIRVYGACAMDVSMRAIRSATLVYNSALKPRDVWNGTNSIPKNSLAIYKVSRINK